MTNAYTYVCPKCLEEIETAFLVVKVWCSVCNEEMKLVKE